MASDGGSEQRLTTHPAFDHRPHWSPDGARIVFGTNRDGNLEVYVMNADGTDVMRLTESPVWEIFPRFSPDGKTIVFASVYVGGPEADVHLMRATGGEERALTSYPGQEETIAWSPDGDYLAFQAEHDGNFEICIMSADGQNLRRLTHHPAADNWPTRTRQDGPPKEGSRPSPH